MVKSPRNFYVFDSSHWAQNNAILPAAHGIQGGAHIIECILNLRRRWINMDAGWRLPFYIYGDANNYIQFFNGANMYTIWIRDATGNTAYNIYKSMMDFDVITFLLQGASTKIMFDGQIIITDPAGRCPNFNGINIDMRIASFAAGHVAPHNICGFRWNNYSAGALPAGSEDEARKRSVNPWSRSTIFGDANLRLEYLLDSLVPDASLVIPNRANPGVGDLTITPAGAWSTVRKAWRTP